MNKLTNKELAEAINFPPIEVEKFMNHEYYNDNDIATLGVYQMMFDFTLQIINYSKNTGCTCEKMEIDSVLTILGEISFRHKTKNCSVLQTLPKKQTKLLILLQ